MKMRLCFILIFFLLSFNKTYADSYVLIPENTDTSYNFGDIRVILNYNTLDTYSLKYTLKIYKKDKLISEHVGIGFDKIFSSPKNKYFLGVSNNGLIKYAYVIFDENGKILKKVEHNTQEINYCNMSITVIREWYNEKEPNVRFKVVHNKLEDIQINSCKNKQISLMQIKK